MTHAKAPLDKIHFCNAPTRGGERCRRRVRRADHRCHLHRAEPAGGTGEESRVVIRQNPEEDRFTLLEGALDQARFWEQVEGVRREAGLDPSGFSILIKPDLEIFDPGAPTGTDPRLVEHLILLLHRRGYANVAVADGPGSADLWLENRAVPVLADRVGYRCCTDEGGGYDVLSLSDDRVEGGFGPGSALCGSQLGRAWRDAHFRISMAKNKTDEAFYFSLGVKNLLTVPPLRNKDYHYHHRLDPAEVCMALLDRTPVHFAIIDGVISNHGGEGIRRPNPLRTNTVIAGDSLLLTDFVAAFKMGLDPYASPLNGKVLRTLGLPRRYEIDGDLSPYPGWENVSKALAESVRRRDRSAAAARMIRPWLQQVDTEVFGFKSSLDARLNDLVATWLGGMERQPAATAARVALNHALAQAGDLIHGYRVLYDKDRLSRRRTGLAMRLEDYGPRDYETMVDYLQPLSRVAAKTPPDRNGLQWRYVDHSVLFQFSRTLPIPYEAFVDRVDIAAAVRLMNDNIGGACVVTARDRQGRVTRQAERNLYLPQPNWMVLFGGDTIDVGKLELIRYEEDSQQIFWRTVTSENRSALYDDGIVTFEKTAEGTTRVTIMARQEFTLPLFWRVVDIDHLPEIKDAIVSDAYTRFFSRTLANYEAAYEGRPKGIGREPDGERDEPGHGGGPPSGEPMAGALFGVIGRIGPAVAGWAREQTHLADPALLSRVTGAEWFRQLISRYGDTLFTGLLQLMGLAYASDPALRKNLEGFQGRYRFRIEDRDFLLFAHFSESGVQLRHDNAGETDAPDVAIAFKNAGALVDFLLSPNPDILDAVLKQDLTVEGNLNYLFKFAYMAKRLQQMMMGAS